MADAADTLARTIWGEARGEGYVGMAAVAAVILTRAAHPRWWGKDVQSVCTAPYQFSCWLQSDPNRGKLETVTASDPQFAQAQEIAGRAIAGTLGGNPTNGADSYYAAGTSIPSWAKKRSPVAIIGRHRFYKMELE